VSGLATVQARIAGIQAQMGAFTGAAGGTLGVASPASGTTSAAATASGEDFAGAMQAALGAAGASGASTAPTAGASRGGADGADLVEAARRYVGVPYRWGGTDPATGLDCSGLVQRAMADVGVEVPRTSAQQSRIGQPVASLAQARPGDLVYLRNPDHIGIYVGDGKMLHAPRSGDVVKVSKVWETPAAIRRVLPADGAAAGVTGAAGSSAPTGAGGATSGSAAAGRAAALALGAPSDLAGLFGAAEARNGLPTGLLSSVARAESGFRTGATSPAGAVGLMQIMPGTARELGVDPRNPAQAVDGAARLLRSHLDRFGSTPLALAAYNAGPGAVSRHGGIPPYPETQNYVRRVTGFLAGGTR
jgi:peptidoglycan DL-endopeptidase CwlO